MDLRQLSALQSYTAAKPATQPDPNATPDPGTAIRGATQDFVQTLRHGEQTAIASMSGAADPHALVQALAQTELAVETAVTVRNKVVEAYQEILRMPV
ncbi:flagellar hook-basal body complex protein FliE [Chachezhania antarctica]|uniref:flagellar hook-basal body complex protein FliE n=1 Tax=Chachezhania antarctica TaxID=2340860 RepID=UPI000EB5340B|nr:flagellar hook-basal body complex protein FliE [Chachezhania antarctica]|tara:strand:- start:12758 stop:13051 length:294 start_codon:yes stop_codon:yes gene_type:complete